MVQEDRRLQLHEILCDILGSRQVYYQPPASVKMEYPAIVYSLDGADTKFASNKPYSHKRRYQVTYMDRKPDSPIYDKLAALPMCLFERWFAANQLNHNVFNLYF